MAELKAAKTVASFGTRVAREVPAAMTVSWVALARQSRPQGIETHCLEEIAGEQLVIVVARRLLRAGQLGRTAQQLLERLRHHHRWLRRAADDETHQGDADPVVVEALVARGLLGEAAAQNIVLGQPGRAALVHETLDVRTQAGGKNIDFGPQRRIVGPIDELEFEQAGRPDAQVLAGRIRYAEIGSQHLESDPARQRIDDLEITFRVRHDLFGELVDRGDEALGDIGRPHDLQQGGDVVAIDLECRPCRG